LGCGRVHAGRVGLSARFVMKTGARIAFVYVLVSAFATVANIGTQAVSMWVYRGAYAVELSVLAGTVMGFPIKYMLEKKYVFDFKADNFGHDTRLFIHYGFMGVFTTAIFWGNEFAFQYIYGTDAMRYFGGAIGLTLGSFIKYRLDKRFVFKQVQA
jgi:putative flippase GtrA